MSKFTAHKRLNNTCNPSFIKPVNCEWAKSFNDESTLDENTKYLIIGTLTPPQGRGKCNNSSFLGYFYCSDKNDMFEFIDKAFPNRSIKLVELKRQFKDNNWDPLYKEEIKKELKERKIAFLDVVKEAYVKVGSSKDDDIDSYRCDYEAFQNIKDDIKIVANSANALVALKHILYKNNDSSLVNKFNPTLIPQRVLGYWNTYQTKDSLAKAWFVFLNS